MSRADHKSVEGIMRPFVGFDWGVVVLGAWNPAILTPEGISTELFGNQPGEKIQVLVSLQGKARPKAMIEGLGITATYSRLTVDLDSPTFESLEKARKIAVKALRALPRTPVTAAGFNIRYKGSVSDVDCDKVWCSPHPDLSEANYEIEARGFIHRLCVDTGYINLKAEALGNSFVLELNFHKDGKEHQDLVEWLEMPLESVKGHAKRITDALGVLIEEGE